MTSQPRWQLQKAKTQFSEVVERAQNGEPQVVTKHGRPAVAVIRFEDFLEWQKSRMSAWDALRPRNGGILENEEADQIFARLKDPPPPAMDFE